MAINNCLLQLMSAEKGINFVIMKCSIEQWNFSLFSLVFVFVVYFVCDGCLSEIVFIPFYLYCVIKK